MTADKQEVLRYLGWKGQSLDATLEQLVDSCIAECHATARPRTVHCAFPISQTAEGLQIEGTVLVLPGSSIQNHLTGAEAVVLLAATLGQEIDASIHRLLHRDMTQSVIFDAAATALIEACCDQLEAQIAAEAAEQGFHCGSRFSPGYGDLPLQLQPQFLAALNASRAIGLTCSPACILQPSKSVTAVIGLFRESQEPPGKSCDTCSMRGQCLYRKENGGRTCHDLT